MNAANSINPIELDATITALGNIWLQSFLQLHDPTTKEEDVIATATAASALLRQVLRLSREQTTIISQEQLRHLKREDSLSESMTNLLQELRQDIALKFEGIYALLQPIANNISIITEKLTHHDTRITQLEHDMQLLKGYLHD